MVGNCGLPDSLTLQRAMSSWTRFTNSIPPPSESIVFTVSKPCAKPVGFNAFLKALNSKTKISSLSGIKKPSGHIRNNLLQEHSGGVIREINMNKNRNICSPGASQTLTRTPKGCRITASWAITLHTFGVHVEVVPHIRDFQNNRKCQQDPNVVDSLKCTQTHMDLSGTSFPRSFQPPPHATIQ